MEKYRRMEEIDFESISEKLREHLDSSRQNWLFGAEISYKSNRPLMIPLTHIVEKINCPVFISVVQGIAYKYSL